MESKKHPNVDVGRNSSLYFAIGLNVMLLFTWVMFEHKTYGNSEKIVANVIINNEFEEDIPITSQELFISPPPQRVAPELIMVVENKVELEETIIESSETNQNEVIEKQSPIAIEDIKVEEPEEDIEVSFAVVEQVPIFPGCTGNNIELKVCFQKMISRHIAENFKYPEDAIVNEQQGKVFVMFYIDTYGNISNMRSRGPYKLLEKEAERIISLLPKMEPARQRNIPVKVAYAVPIVFKISED